MSERPGDALGKAMQVVTASRRLARALSAEHAEQQIAAGRSVWETPLIHAWQDWLARLVAGAKEPGSLPARINAHQSQVLWERCLRREISDPLLNVPMLVKQARQSWTRLKEFRVPLDECVRQARGRDQRMFASAASNYASILQREHWIDDAGLAELVIELVAAGRIDLPESVTVAGFDRYVPMVEALLGSIAAAGTQVDRIGPPEAPAKGLLTGFESSDAELRCAGRWAREVLDKHPDQKVAIIVTNLERDAARCARLVLEGLIPGWQFGGDQHSALVNVSYGQRLSSYPLVSVALLLLRWMHTELSSREVALLLRSAVTGSANLAGRSRLELYLRQIPERRWSPELLHRAMSGKDESPDAQAWLTFADRLDELRSQLPRRDSASSWAMRAHELLEAFGWPGDGKLGSQDFQLVNAWRELLNAFARLDLVIADLSAGEAMTRLAGMAAETVFQPESEGAVVDLMGPLEASGMTFDSLWVCGLDADQWPPPGRPLVLVSRTLQREYQMPDAEPQDTLDYAGRVLSRLTASADNTVCSYAITEGDAQRTGTGLLAHYATTVAATDDDPGWYASRQIETHKTQMMHSDPVPAVGPDERISGGASSLHRQLEEPFAAFAYGRLGIRFMPALVPGLTASVRGSLIHDALHRLYHERPAQADIAAWPADEVKDRIANAVQGAFGRHYNNADSVLRALLNLEARRVRQLLGRVVDLDRSREPFTIADAETPRELTVEGLRLRLRVDRIDRLDNGELVILDYKTGQERRFLSRDGKPKDLQLVIYAFAVDEAVSDLGLVNIDSRSISISGAGRTFTPDLDWGAALQDWRNDVQGAAARMSRGDVRINGLLSRQAARPLALLSRIAELRRDD